MDKKTDKIIQRINDEIKTAIETLGEAYEHSIYGINEEIGRLKQIIEPESISDMPEFERGLLEGMYGSKIEDLQENALSEVRGAFLLIIYGFIERILDRITRVIDKRQLSMPKVDSKIQLPLDKLTGNKAVRAITFLKYVVGLELSEFFVKEFSLIADLRNAFAHSGGVINTKRKENIEGKRNSLKNEYFDSLLDFTIRKYDEERFIIKLDTCFISELISRSTIALNKIISEISKKITLWKFLNELK